jgi:hypothetical protein
LIFWNLLNKHTSLPKVGQKINRTRTHEFALPKNNIPQEVGGGVRIHAVEIKCSVKPDFQQ